MERDFIVLGATLDPHAAFLIQRGLKTYFVRFERQSETALTIARFLESHPAVARVHYPGLLSHPRHALAARQMQGFGTIVTLELAQGRDPAHFADALKLFAISASLGSTESLVQPGQLMRARDLSDREQQWAAITDRTIRLSIGLEDPQDLIEDLDQALNGA
jgi:cystathionine beta-lyase/cystathionine gamma-synthase